MNAVVISLDAELGWGLHHHRTLPAERIHTARENWHRLLAMFDERAIPVTWAVVGHLLQRDCSTEHTGHPAGPRCCTTGGTIDPDDAWFANGLVEAIRDADASHEIASHGYTHVNFGHDAMDRTFADRELEACVAACRDRGVRPDSFVFPVNRVGYRDLLAEHGFVCYRGNSPDDRSGTEKFTDAVLDRGAPPIVQPSVDEHGLVNVPASTNLFAFEGWARSFVAGLHGDPVESRVKRGLDHLCDGDGVLHLWLHPHDLRRPRHFDRLRSVLDAVARGRETGAFQVETMRRVASNHVSLDAPEGTQRPSL